MIEAEAKESLRSLLLDYNYIKTIQQSIKLIINDIADISEKLKTCSNEVKSILIERTKTLSNEIKEKERIIFKIQESNKQKINTINMLEQPQKSVLQYHYVYGLKYEDIADKLNYSLPRIFQYHKIGIKDYTNLVTHNKSIGIDK